MGVHVPKFTPKKSPHCWVNLSQNAWCVCCVEFCICHGEVTRKRDSNNRVVWAVYMYRPLSPHKEQEKEINLAASWLSTLLRMTIPGWSALHDSLRSSAAVCRSSQRQTEAMITENSIHHFSCRLIGRLLIRRAWVSVANAKDDPQVKQTNPFNLARFDYHAMGPYLR